MSLQLILGSSGSGKSYQLYHEVIEKSEKNRETDYVIIVPEQFTMQTQKDLVQMHPRKGILNIDILSFMRLAYRVFGEAGGEDRPVLEDMGKSMLVRKVMGQKQEKLVLFRPNVKKQGYISEVKSLLSEFLQYSIREDTLEQMIEDTKKKPLLQRKLEDMQIIYQGFRELIEEKYITTEEVLDVLVDVLEQSEWVKKCVFCFDGFTGFTPAQYKVLTKLMGMAKKVVITITLDERENFHVVDEPFQLFHISKKTISKLYQIADNERVKIEKEVVLSGTKRFTGSRELEMLERNLFRYPFQKYKEETKDISIHIAKTARNEIDFTVTEINRLIREEGYRYRDIAVVTGDMETYGRLAEESYEKAGFSYFIDHKKSILGNPVVEMLRAVLEILDKDFDYESMFRYLRSDLTGIPKEDVDMVENYVLACGIRGWKRWNQTWERNYTREIELPLAYINEIREQIIAPLLTLREAVKGKKHTVLEYSTAIHQFMVSMNLYAQLKEYETKFMEEGEVILAKEYGKIYEMVLEILDRFVEILGEEKMTLKEYGEILDTGFQEAKMGLIPPGIDQIVVGDIERTRLKDIKALFFLGVNDGMIPKSGGTGGIISDLEREEMSQMGIELAPTIREKAYTEQFYLYLNLTKPREHLYISYHKAGEDGKPANVSYLIGKIKNIFPHILIVEEEEKIHSVFEKEERKNGVSKEKMESGILEESQEEVLNEERKSRILEESQEGIAKKEIGIAKEKKGIAKKENGVSKEKMESGILEESQKKVVKEEAIKKLADEILGADKGKHYILEGIREYAYEDMADWWKELYQYYFRHAEEKQLKQWLSGAAYCNEESGISKEVANALYGSHLVNSVTRVEQYAACAFAHFLTYGLKLQERKRYEIRIPDLGNIFHQVLERFSKQMKKEGLSFRTIEEEQRNKLVDECLAQVISEYGDSIFTSTKRNEYLLKRVERMTKRTIWALCEHMKAGQFEAAAYEVKFDHLDALDSTRIQLSEEEILSLQGRIDRLDKAEDENGIYIKVIDYKSGKTKLELEDLYYGLQMQLVVYLDAALEIERNKKENAGKEIIPAGIFYYNIDDPVLEEIEKENADKELLKALKMNGLINSDTKIVQMLDKHFGDNPKHLEGSVKSDVVPVETTKEGAFHKRSSVVSEKGFEQLMKHVRKQIEKCGKEILDGRTAIEPYHLEKRTGCDYCPYDGVCAFDTRLPGNQYKMLKKLSKEDVWELLEKESEAEEKNGEEE